MLTHLRTALVGAVAISAIWAVDAAAFWPFVKPPIDLAPSYGGACEGCDLSGRILAGARLTDSNFNNSDFSSAVLMRANASGSEFANADFTDADLRRSRLVGAECPRATFARAMLNNADARGANFRRASFNGANVTRMNLEAADISGADLSTAQGLTQTQLDRACGDRRTRLPRGLRVRICD